MSTGRKRSVSPLECGGREIRLLRLDKKKVQTKKQETKTKTQRIRTQPAEHNPSPIQMLQLQDLTCLNCRNKVREDTRLLSEFKQATSLASRFIDTFLRWKEGAASLQDLRECQKGTRSLALPFLSSLSEIIVESASKIEQLCQFDVTSPAQAINNLNETKPEGDCEKLVRDALGLVGELRSGLDAKGSPAVRVKQNLLWWRVQRLQRQKLELAVLINLLQSSEEEDQLMELEERIHSVVRQYFNI